MHRNFKTLFADDVYAKFLGFSGAEEVLALDSLLELIHPDERERSIQSYHDIMNRITTPGVQSFKNLKKNGETTHVIVLEHIIEYEGEEALQVTVIDVTKMYTAQERLIEIENRYIELVEGSLQAILVHKNFKPLFCNLAYAELLGFKNVDEVYLLDSILPLIPKNSHPRSIETNQQLLSGEVETLKYETEGYNINKEELRVLLSAKRVNWKGEKAVQVTAMDITKQHLLRQQIEHRATYDGLTQLLNRTSVSEKFECAVIESKFNDQPLSCVLIDIDNFKFINDNYGHVVGDSVLKMFSVTCKSAIRQTDFIGRWGGEEFIVIFPKINATNAHKLADRLREKLASASVNTEQGMINFTVSMGISSTIDGCFSVNKLVTRADKALYKAKKQGKNRVVSESLLKKTYSNRHKYIVDK